MKAKTGFLNGVSSSMVAAVLGTMVLCVFFTLKLQNARELPRDFNRLDNDIAESQALISNLVAAPILPSLKTSWREVSAALELAGLVLVPDDGTIVSSGSNYEGPLKNWVGSVSGDPLLVLSVVKKIQQTDPVYLLDYTMVDGEFKLILAVVGI